MYPKASSYPLGKVHAHMSQWPVCISTLVFKLFSGDLSKTAKATELHPTQLPEKPLHIGQLNVSNGQTDVLIIQTHVYLTHFVLSTSLFWTFGFLTINQKFLENPVVFRKYLFGYRNRTAEKVVCVLGWNVPMEICHLFLSNRSLIPVSALLVGQFFCKCHVILLPFAQTVDQKFCQ